MKTIKKISIAITLLLVYFCANAQNGKINPYGESYEKDYKKLRTWELFYDIRSLAHTKWLYFRLETNPYLDHTKYGSWISPGRILLPDSIYTKYDEVKLDIYRLEEMPQYKKNINDSRYRQAALTESPYIYIIEKKDGLDYYKRLFSGKIIDSVHVNIYDSIYPYDNRFLVSYNGREMKCYSGNVSWNSLAKYTTIAGVGYLRGAQFGVEYVQMADSALNTKLRELRPEHPEYVYATAEQSFLSRGTILIAGNPKTLSDYIEFIFYSDDPAKTGDQRGTYYEMRYVLPTEIESIKERRMIKRKLTEEEQHKMLTSYLRRYRDMTKQEQNAEFLRREEEQEKREMEESMREEERLKKEKIKSEK